MIATQLRFATARRTLPVALNRASFLQSFFAWNFNARVGVRVEADVAALFYLFGISRKYVDCIMETFPIVERRDVAASGSFRTKEHILDVYDAMQTAIETGSTYRSPLDREQA